MGSWMHWIQGQVDTTAFDQILLRKTVTTLDNTQKHILETENLTGNEIEKFQRVIKGYLARKDVDKAESIKLPYYTKPNANKLVDNIANIELQENSLSPKTPQSPVEIPSLSAKVAKLLKKLGDMQFPVISDDVEVENRPAVGYENGDVYVGQWYSWKRHGVGKIYFANGSLFEGHFQEDHANGQGRMLMYDGQYYIGKYRDNKQHGQGKLHKDYKTFYSGGWKTDMREGRGHETWADGSRYKGEWCNNRKHGKGLFTWPDGRIFKGMFKDDKFEGKGKLTYLDGKVYVGSWKNNQMHGRGVFTWPDGRKYKGEYKNDKKHGHGKFSFPNGKIYVGDWHLGKQHGEAKFRKDWNDKSKQGIWENGQHVRWIEEGSNSTYILK